LNSKLFFSNINSWSDLKNLLETKTKQEKGQAFEELTKYFLQYNPVYKTKLKQVWLQKEVPQSVIKKLNLPSNDQGIDLIAETFEGTYWAIQCKYLQDEEQTLSHRSISTFVSLSSKIADNISYELVCATVDNIAKIYKGNNRIGFVNSEEWRKLDKNFFDFIRAKIKGKELKKIPYKPKPHQEKALKEAKEYFLKENNSRGKLVFPCGAGKSLTGYWITRELKPQSIIVAVPSLSLVKQTLEVYLRESVANNEKVSWLCVCSDEGIGKNDDIAIHTNEIGVPCVTDKNFIAKWIKDNSKNKTIIFTTYQSGKTIAEACKIAKHEFDLGIMDEAHKTVGDKDRLFSHLLFDKNLKIKKRIFMTATERIYKGASNDVVGMEDQNIYGDSFTELSFKEAIDKKILSDYKIVTLFISNEEVKKLITQNAFVKPEGKEWDKETEARTLASLIALRKAMNEYPINHAVTFHSSIKKAAAFDDSQNIFSSAYPEYGKVNSFHVSGKTPTSERGKTVDEFAKSERAIITNAKCLTEGVDVPNIDCVLFADPRKSRVDIVQALGRALRRVKGKDFGYVILPVFTDGKTEQEIVDSEEFNEILYVIRALAANDERIAEYFKDRSINNNHKSNFIRFDLDADIAEKINGYTFLESIQLKIWNKLAKFNFMPFEEARAYVRKLKLKDQKAWVSYTKSGDKPQNIPANPPTVYKTNGWIGFGDWLGNSNKSNRGRVYLNFSEARKIVHKLNLKSVYEYQEWHRKNRPLNIPSKPERIYGNEGYISWPDWLGTKSGHKVGDYYSYDEAKQFLKKLNLKDENGWIEYCKSGLKPSFIPTNPRKVYKNVGWLSIGDFLSYKVGFKTNVYIDFKAARSIVRKKKIKSRNDWIAYTKNKMFWNNIPKEPHLYYAKFGFTNYKDWLGTDQLGHKDRVYRDFKSARKYVRGLKLKNQYDWVQFSKSKKRPYDIPSNPQQKYANEWISLGDWLGTKSINKV
jgi:superfamily II DNA or RNA helicase